jgi:hypothetical protein
MNDTLDVYWDGCDGEDLACSLGNVASEYENYCLYTGEFMGSVQLLGGLLLFHVVYMYHNMYKTSPGNSSNDARIKKRSENPTSNSGKQRQSLVSRKKSRQHGKSAALVVGIQTNLAAFVWLVSAHGTRYPSTHVRGILGDLSTALYFAVAWNVARRQVQGARWFKSLVHLNAETQHQSHGLLSRIPSPVKVLDFVQRGAVALVISLTLFGLVVAQVLPRAWFYVIGYTICALSGLRSFLSIATQRIDALRKVAAVQQQVRGTVDDKKRRNGILKNKALALVLDLSGVFISSVLCSASLVLLGSLFSSKQLIVHYSVNATLNVTMLWLVALNMRSKVRRARRKCRSAFQAACDTERDASNVSGMSGIEQSEVLE